MMRHKSDCSPRLLHRARGRVDGRCWRRRSIRGLRGPTPLNDEGPAAADDADAQHVGQASARNYPEQPPVIPHSIDGYQIDINVNKCLSCHARAAHRRIAGADGQRSPTSWTATASSSPRSRRGAIFCTAVPCAAGRRASRRSSNDFVDIDTC